MCVPAVVRMLFVVLVAVGSAQVAVAQEAVNYASVSGRVTDPGRGRSGRAGHGAPDRDQLTREVDTDDEGRFRFPYLEVGPYEITVALDGFADATRSLTLTVGSAFELPVSLAVGDLDTAVTVTAEADRSRGGAQPDRRNGLADGGAEPALNGRNFLDLALLVPGVSPTNVGSTQLFAETSAVPGQGISVGSQRNFSNNFIVDGLSANDDAAGLERHTVRRRRGGSVSGRHIGRAGRAGARAGRLHQRRHQERHEQSCTAICTVTCATTASMRANALSGTKLPMTQKQYGVSLGGPIVRDRTFYFANFEQRRLDQSGLVTISARTSPSSTPGWPQSAIRVRRSRPGSIRIRSRPPTFLAKVDHQINAGISSASATASTT